MHNVEIREQYQNYMFQQAEHILIAFGPKATEIAFNECEYWINAFLLHIDSNYKYMREYFESNLPELILSPLECSYLTWINFEKLGMDIEELNNFIAHDSHLDLSPGFIFGENFSQFQRMNIACSKEVLVSSLNRLKKAINNLV